MIYTYEVYIMYFKEEMLKEFKYTGNIVSTEKLPFTKVKEMAEYTALGHFLEEKNSYESLRFVLLNALKINEIFA